ncbi:MAG: PEP-CTERM sorting domain-containing protein, partial [Planctomycetota bacterium]|nr:PEP-CTERM sorting domain-containing protein [Planctomycetota bacterium]
MNGAPHNNAQQVWDKFLSKDSQIFMVLCGHNFNGAGYPANRRTDADVAGQSVYQLLSDYQATPSSVTAGVGTGGGWVRLMEFNPDLNQVHVRTYSSELQKYSDDLSLTDGSTYARTWAPFNYAGGGTGALLASTDAASSDFTIGFNFADRFNVPEPTTLSLLAVAGLLALRRRRNALGRPNPGP